MFFENVSSFLLEDDEMTGDDMDDETDGGMDGMGEDDDMDDDMEESTV